MPTIKLITHINASVETCFNLSRSIDLHVNSMQHTGERAIAGKTSGPIGLNETVTWQAKHFALAICMTVKITELMYATSFTDEQVKGPFKKLRHRHIFQYVNNNSTVMTDEFEFTLPMGFIGRVVSERILQPYLTKLLEKRNAVIKQAAEKQTELICQH